MIPPSPEFLASRLNTKSREERCVGATCVALENFATPNRPVGVCVVRASFDGGRTVRALAWTLPWWTRLRLAAVGRDWPPTRCYLGTLDEAAVEVHYLDLLDESRSRLVTLRHAFARIHWEWGGQR